MLAAQSALIAHPSATYVGVSSGTTTRTSSRDGTTSTSYLSARVILERNTVSDTELAEKLAKILANSHADASQMDVIQIVLAYGYDIGIASSWSNYSHTYRPVDLVGEN